MGKTARFFLRLLIFAVFFFLPGCGVPTPNGPTESYGVDFTPPAGVAPEQIRGAIVFVVDGLNADTFQEMLRAGELPNLQRDFVDRGLYAPRAAANLPSVTLANLASLATGRFCGRHGVVGINWFDRRECVYRNYHTLAQKNRLDEDCVAKMLYQHWPEEFTVSVFFQPHRGATKFFENWLSAGPAFHFEWFEFVDRLTLFRFGEMMDLARRRGQFPKLVFAYLLAPDFQAYRHGASSRAYRDAIRHADRQIGRVLGDLRRAGLLDRMHLAVVSDHSHSDVKDHFDLTSFLRETLGLRVAERRLWEETPAPQRQAYYEHYDTVVCGSGERYRAIHRLRQGDGADLTAALAGRDEVDCLAWPTGPGRVRVRTKGGTVEFAQPAGPAGLIAYRILTGDDPLGYRQALGPGRSAKMSSRQWLTATVRTNYPDLPAQILAYFESPRAGDMVAFASPGWDFGGGHAGGHGGVRGTEDMLVPLLLAGPGVPHTTVPCARTVDLYPTILTLLGKPLPPGLDGRALVEPKR